MFQDANIIKRNDEVRADLCIIGAGAVGITLALALKDSGLNIVLLETGDFKEHDEARELSKIETTALPLSEPSRARGFGGTTQVWAARFRPFDPDDFEKKDWVPHSGWPINFEDVRPYYQQAARLLDAPQLEKFQTATLEHFLNKSSHKLLDDSAIQTTVFQWLKQEDWDWGKKYKAAFEARTDLRVVLKANVIGISINDSGNRVERVLVKTVAGNEFRVSARKFILAGGGLENARLLLMSRSTAHPNGLGNNQDVVGRFYMDHPKGVVGEIKPFDRNLFLPAYWGTTENAQAVRGGIALAKEFRASNRILNSYCLLEPVFPWSYNPGLSAFIAFAQAVKRRKIPSDILVQYGRAMIDNRNAILGWVGSQIQKRIFNRQARIQKMTVWNFMEQAPDPDNRVTLSGNLDRLGCPKIQLTWKIRDLDKLTMRTFHRVLKEELLKFRIGELRSPLLDDTLTEWPIKNDASHHMGTTRMGNDPATSVVDLNCKVHGIENLYIGGSSVFPTVGYANPTFTIVALAVRLAEHIKTKIFKVSW